MEFDNTFRVNSPPEKVWAFMLNAQEVTPCVPGAQITEVIDETHYKGSVKIKLGAVQMTYRGELEMRPDPTTQTIVIQAKGTETRGSGGASGIVTTVLLPFEGGGTQVDIHSHVDVTGRVAQFGRGIMQDVSNRLIREFAQCLERKLNLADTPSEGGLEESPHEESDGESHSESSEPTATSTTPVPTSPSPSLPPPSSAASKQASFATTSQVPPRAQPQQVREDNASTAGAELRIGPILISLIRSRTAAGLRAIANLIEPK